MVGGFNLCLSGHVDLNHPDGVWVGKVVDVRLSATANELKFQVGYETAEFGVPGSGGCTYRAQMTVSSRRLSS